MGAPMRIWLTPAKRTLARRISDWLGVEAGVAAITLVSVAIITLVTLTVFG
jgi:hypothetical protein